MSSLRAGLHRLAGFSRRLSRSVFSSRATPQEVAQLDNRSKFLKVYEDNVFGGRESRSGEGSNLIQTQVIRSEIPKILAELKIGVILDAPCGDWNWMQVTDLGNVRYVGVDIVAPLIEKNSARFGSDKVRFVCADLVKDNLPKADLIFSRDCLVHLSFDDSFQTLRNFQATGARFLLTTTFTDRKENPDLKSTFWRPLNLQVAPFNFHAPLRLINERCTESGGGFSDKSLGLWDLADLPLSR